MLSITTCQAPNSNAVVEGLATYLTSVLETAVDLKVDMPWQRRADQLEAGEIDLGWVCGLPYSHNIDGDKSAYELLAAPVRSAPRYQDAPVYFSDIVVRESSWYQSFADLRGARWAFNEPASFSGYTVVMAHLADMGEHDFFGELIEEGSHERALAMIKAYEVDGAAIDSTVLERQRLLDPTSVQGLRVIGSLGPNPAPPLVMRRSLAPHVKASVREATLRMHLDPLGRGLLAEAQLARFQAVDDADYNPIRAADAKAANISG